MLVATYTTPGDGLVEAISAYSSVSLSNPWYSVLLVSVGFVQPLYPGLKAPLPEYTVTPTNSWLTGSTIPRHPPYQTLLPKSAIPAMASGLAFDLAGLLPGLPL